MRQLLVIVVYDRYENIVRWINNWKLCDQHGFEMVVIHNDNGESEKFKKLCDENGVTYIRRDNIGYDIGAFQDVCMERLEGFNDYWGQMLWCTDDILPIRKNFISDFLVRYFDNTLPCMEISKEVRLHIRTTAFLISKDISMKLKFNVDPIRTKEDCYYFEHLGGNNIFLAQVQALGVTPVMIMDLKISSLWDIGNKRHLRMNRWAEYKKEFEAVGEIEKQTESKNKEPKVTIICPIFNSFPKIIGDLICQTHKNWNLILVHDGKSETDLIRRIVDAVNDERINYIETESRVSYWGHKIRRDYLQSLKNTDTEYVLIANPDNAIPPIFIEKMIRPMLDDKNIYATYCEAMVHNYVDYKTINCKLERGYIDCQGVIVRKDIACSVGYNKVEHHSADWYYFEDIIKKYGALRFAKVSGNLIVHN